MPKLNCYHYVPFHAASSGGNCIHKLSPGGKQTTFSRSDAIDAYILRHETLEAFNEAEKNLRNGSQVWPIYGHVSFDEAAPVMPVDPTAKAPDLPLAEPSAPAPVVPVVEAAPRRDALRRMDEGQLRARIEELRLVDGGIPAPGHHDKEALVQTILKAELPSIAEALARENEADRYMEVLARNDEADGRHIPFHREPGYAPVAPPPAGPPVGGVPSEVEMQTMPWEQLKALGVARGLRDNSRVKLIAALRK